MKDSEASRGLLVALGVALPIIDALRASMRSSARLGTARVVSDVAAMDGSALDARLAALTMLLRLLAAEIGGWLPRGNPLLVPGRDDEVSGRSRSMGLLLHISTQRSCRLRTTLSALRLSCRSPANPPFATEAAPLPPALPLPVKRASSRASEVASSNARYTAGLSASLHRASV